MHGGRTVPRPVEEAEVISAIYTSKTAWPSYQPICLLDTIGKMLERVVHNKLVLVVELTGSGMGFVERVLWSMQ